MSLQENTTTPPGEWSFPEKILFRFFFIYFIIQAIPLDWKFYGQLFSTDWKHLYYGDIFALTHYVPKFFFATYTYADWGIIALISIAGALAWSYADAPRNNYNVLYYWLRVILRYRLAVAVIAYGFIKLFPLQAPIPSLSSLNTSYGDFTEWKIFSLSVGIVPDYEAFLGFFEILAGLLLLYRKTTLFGAFIILLYIGNVAIANLAYGGGEDVYSFYLVSIALFLFAYDVPRIISLLTLERPTFPVSFKPVFYQRWQQQGRFILKSVFLLFFVLFYGFKTWQGYKQGITKYPQEQGLENISGVYAVTTFSINNDTLPYANTDPVRWKDVVFEKWNTLSIRSNQPVQVDYSNVETIARPDRNKTYEYEGSGGRHYYTYEVDARNNVLYLQNRNKLHQHDKFVLHISSPDSLHVVLSGKNEQQDSIYVVLNKINKRYLLEEVARQGREVGLKL